MKLLDWETAVALRLGTYWQQAEDYERARHMYRRVLEALPHHSPTLLNLAVCEIRTRHYREALEHLNRLAADVVPRGDLQASEIRWSSLAFSVAYNRALALSYRAKEAGGELADERAAEHEARLLVERLVNSLILTDRPVRRPRRYARRAAPYLWMQRLRGWDRALGGLIRNVFNAEPPATPTGRVRGLPNELLRRLLDQLNRRRHRPLPRRQAKRNVSVEQLRRMEGPALMLYAGLSVKRTDVRRVAREFLDVQARSVDRSKVRGAIGTPAAAEVLPRYVWQQTGEDPRARYNLACFAARLSADVETDGDQALAAALRDQAVSHARFAHRDPGLREWSAHDPALEPLKGHPEWTELIEESPSADEPPDRQAALGRVEDHSKRATPDMAARLLRTSEGLIQVKFRPVDKETDDAWFPAVMEPGGPVRYKSDEIPPLPPPFAAADASSAPPMVPGWSLHKHGAQSILLVREADGPVLFGAPAVFSFSAEPLRAFIWSLMDITRTTERDVALGRLRRLSGRPCHAIAIEWHQPPDTTLLAVLRIAASDIAIEGLIDDALKRLPVSTPPPASG